MNQAATGRYIETTLAGERIRAFVPEPLPLEFSIGPELRELLDRAIHALGRLSASALYLPD